MRIIVGSDGQSEAVFLVEADRAMNLTSIHSEVGTDLMGLINNPELFKKIEQSGMSEATVPVAAITPSLPVSKPGKIVCLGLNYIDHIKEGGYEVPTYPALFMRSNTSMMAAGQPMVRPKCSHELDYEVELMVIIGKGGRHIAEEDALSHIFAYTLFNDGSVRNYQRKTHQWTPGKNFDNTGAVGPFSVTPDELPAGAVGLKIESRVGDEILQSANTDDMMWSVARTLAMISEYSTLEPGDLVAMGTPPGVGHARKPQRWLVPGETVEVEIEGIGVCASPIIDEADFTAKGV